MKGLLEEIQEIPERAAECYQKHAGLVLPTNVPYIGMGSSYYAALTVYGAGCSIVPYIASEYYSYLAKGTMPLGVLISQSGESSETVWCKEKFAEIVAISSSGTSTLARGAKTYVDLCIGKEEHTSSTKSYVNTLIALYQGLGIDPAIAVKELGEKFPDYDRVAKIDATTIAAYLSTHTTKGLYIIGSGPNTGTAHQVALTLSEVTKRCWTSMTVAQYDHGPKETAQDSVVIALDSQGKDSKRLQDVLKLITSKTNACVIHVTEDSIGEILSPIPFIARMSLCMNYLADALAITDIFALGGKVTRVDETLR